MQAIILTNNPFPKHPIFVLLKQGDIVAGSSSPTPILLNSWRQKGEPIKNALKITLPFFVASKKYTNTTSASREE